MRVILSVILMLFVLIPAIGQETSFIEVDSLYREDQIYAGVTYNLLGST